MVKLSDLAKRYRIENGDGFRLKDCDPADTASLDDKDLAKEALADSVARLADRRPVRCRNCRRLSPPDTPDRPSAPRCSHGWLWRTLLSLHFAVVPLIRGRVQ